ncbi:MAG: MOSC N-terminal beta barrel domain-containing protein, partial [Alphaproteobacteria bacterium]
MPRLTEIYRYPVKGLSAERLERVTLAPGEGLPLDRAFALALGTTAFDPGAPRPLPKTRFLMLMRNQQLAALETSYDEASGVLSIIREGAEVARGKLGETAGRAAIERFFAAYVGAESHGAPKLVHAPGHSFADVGVKLVSLINLASVAALEA